MWRNMIIVLLVLFLVTPPNAGAQGQLLTHVAWSPDGTMLAISGDQTVRIVDAVTLHVLNTFTVVGESFAAPAWNFTGEQLAITNGPEVQVWQHPWDVEAMHLMATLPIDPPQSVMSIAWDPTADRLAVGYGKLDVWDFTPATPRLLYTQPEHGMWITQVAWDPTGEFLVTTELDYTLKIWDADTGKLVSTMWVITSITTMPAAESYIFPNGVDWSPTPERLVYGAEDGTIRIWDRNELHAAEVTMEWGDEGVYEGHEGPIFAVDWNPTQPLIASSGADHTVRIWDADTGEVIQIIQTRSDIGAIAWSPDGDTLVYGLEDGTLERLAFPP